MPLSEADTTRLYSDAFAKNAKVMLGEQAFTIADMRTQLDVAGYRIDVLTEELAAAQKELAGYREAAQDRQGASGSTAEGVIVEDLTQSRPRARKVEEVIQHQRV